MNNYVGWYIGSGTGSGTTGATGATGPAGFSTGRVYYLNYNTPAVAPSPLLYYDMSTLLDVGTQTSIITNNLPLLAPTLITTLLTPPNEPGIINLVGGIGIFKSGH